MLANFGTRSQTTANCGELVTGIAVDPVQGPGVGLSTTSRAYDPSARRHVRAHCPHHRLRRPGRRPRPELRIRQRLPRHRKRRRDSHLYQHPEGHARRGLVGNLEPHRRAHVLRRRRLRQSWPSSRWNSSSTSARPPDSRWYSPSSSRPSAGTSAPGTSASQPRARTLSSARSWAWACANSIMQGGITAFGAGVNWAKAKDVGMALLISPSSASSAPDCSSCSAKPSSRTPASTRLPRSKSAPAILDSRPPSLHLHRRQLRPRLE